MYDKKFKAFVENTLTLFDIAKCKCMDNDCACPRECKVPSKEREFLADQRSNRKMMISTVDRKESRALEKREIRKRKRSESEARPHAFECVSLDLSSSTEDVPVVPSSNKDFLLLTPT